MTQWLNPLALGFSSGHDLAVREFQFHVRLCADSSEPEACSDSVCVSLSALPSALSLSLSKLNKYFKKFEREKGWSSWVAQLVKHQIITHVMISWFVSSTPHIRFSPVSKESAWDHLSLCSTPPHLHTHTLSLSHSVSLSQK